MRFTATHPSPRTRQATAASACRCGSRRSSSRQIRTARRCTSTSAALVAGLLLAGCGGPGRTIRFADVSAQLHGFQPPRLVREEFRSRTELASYLERSSPGAHIRVPSIDWTHREAILVSAGPRSSTGYTLRVLSVRETAHHVVVTVHEDTPTLGEPVQARVTYPFRLITIPRIDKPLHLHWPGRP